MSAETFIQAFENGEPQPIKTKEILECFDGVISNRRADSIDVTFGPQDDSTIYFEVESDEDTGVMVSRPCGDPGLARCLYRLMQLGNCVLFTPEEEGCIVVSSEAAKHMPDDMKEYLGEAQVAADEASFTAMYSV